MIHGVLLINKKEGGTSHDVVSAVRRILRQKAVGHAGTLDPLAEGLLVILLGGGTKLSNYLLTNDKGYRFILRLGVTTDSLDKTGKVTDTKKVQLSEEQIRPVLEKSQGKLLLPVPLISAVKVKGKKLYEYTRQNQPVSPPVREMNFYDLQIKGIYGDKIEVELSCGKGGYVRSWVAFVGEQLGTGACLEELTRIKSAPFHVDSSLSLQEIETRLKAKEQAGGTALPHHKLLEPAFVPFSRALPHLSAVCADKQDEKQLRQGQISKNLRGFMQGGEQKQVNQEGRGRIIRVMDNNTANMLALLQLKPFMSPKIIRVFPPNLF